MDIELFFEKYFRFLTLLFWPIVCYKLIFIQNSYIEYTLFSFYTLIGLTYMILIIFYYIKLNNLRNINLYYKISTLTSYILTLSNFLLFPTNLTLLYLKFISIFAYFYFSCKMVFKIKNEEGVVGIISGILLIVIAIFY